MKNVLENKSIVIGVCTRGPYRFGIESVLNNSNRWISWGYGEEYIHPEILRLLGNMEIRCGSKAVFASWDLNRQKRIRLLREAIIEHVATRPGYVSFTLRLGKLLSGTIQLATRDHYLCRPISS
jgi:hypothetical protein